MAALTVRIHVEPASHELVWWAEAEGLPGWSAAAPSLAELKTLVREAVAVERPKAKVVLELVTAEPAVGAPDLEAPALQDTQRSVGVPSRLAIVDMAAAAVAAA